MRLALSTAAAPGAPLAELEEACARRGLEGLYLTGEFPAPAGRAAVPVAGIEASSWEAAAEMADAAASLGAPVVIPAARVDVAGLAAVADRYAAVGGRLLIAVPTDPAAAGEWARRVGDAAGLGLAWEVAPGTDDLGGAAEVLRALGTRLGLVLLRGGGPETLSQGGQGVGALMARLALSRYAGMVVIGPSRPELHVAWRSWVRRRAGTGCGSASEPKILQIGGGS